MSLLPFTKTVLTGAKCRSNVYTNVRAVRNLMSKELIYNEFGDPLNVVKFRQSEVPPLNSQEVLVRMLAAPVNPADINTIQGKYPIKIKLPMIAGNEGVGIVEETGINVKGMTQGSKVIVIKPAQGTWRDYGVFNKDSLKTVPNELGIAEASTITVNPCTAYRMLTDFKPVREKELVVIQNGANSACGQNVIQLCKAWGIKNIGIIRERPEVEILKDYLKSLGATYILTESELRKTEIFKNKEIEKPSLALNCVGGKSSLEMLRHLQHSGCMVTYGGMSRDPVTIPTSAFIFKNLQFFGFWMTKWNETADSASKNCMLNDIINLMCGGHLKAPVHKLVPFNQYQDALGNALTSGGFTGKNVKLPCLPSVGGDEGVGEVCETGNLVSNVKKGDRVVLSSRMLGSWRYYGIFDERDVHIISPNLPLPEAAMLAITPCMAYRMLKDYRHVLAGQTVLQSAANSACGQCVIQLCRNWGIKTMNIVANHCQYDFVKAHLLSIGADTVLSLEEAEDLCSFDTPVERPVLALNCLGGRCEDVLLQLLQYCGTIVYYGCAYNQPISKHFIRSDATFCRFHLNNWDSQATVMEKDSMLNEIIQLMVIGCLKAPNFQVIELKDYLHAFRNTNHCDAYSTANFLFDLTMP